MFDSRATTPADERPGDDVREVEAERQHEHPERPQLDAILQERARGLDVGRAGGAARATSTLISPSLGRRQLLGKHVLHGSRTRSLKFDIAAVGLVGPACGRQQSPSARHPYGIRPGYSAHAGEQRPQLDFELELARPQRRGDRGGRLPRSQQSKRMLLARRDVKHDDRPLHDSLSVRPHASDDDGACVKSV